MPDSPTAKRSKANALAEDGTLNPAPRKVNDPKFREESFFDPRDIVQVKYEMLRRMSVDKMSVTQVSDEYGVTRPTFYQAKADFEGAGIAGLVPRKRGPRGPHKIQSEVLAFLKAQVSPGEPIRARELTNLVRGEFGLDVHPRTIERALGVKKRRDRRRATALRDAVPYFGRAIRIAAHSRAWHGAASGGALRSYDPFASRYVGLGSCQFDRRPTAIRFCAAAGQHSGHGQSF